MNAENTDPPARHPRVLLVSASDSRFFPLLKGMIESIRPVLERRAFTLACFDIGLEQQDRNWLSRHAAMIASPRAHFGLNAEDHSPALRSFLARPFLRDYFPGHDVYVWIDSDIWLQDTGVVDAYVDGAIATGLAVAHERERAYRFQAWLLAWTAKHFVLGYGPLAGLRLLRQRHLNAGFFAASANAPQWDDWSRCYEAALARTGALVPHDQFALNQALLTGPGARTRTERARFLDPSCNWICDRGVPMWNDAEGVFCKPYPPYERIGALHLAGPAKFKPYAIRRTGGGSFTTFILHGASPARPVGSAALQAASPELAVATA